jgi:hypothetical protein
MGFAACDNPAGGDGDPPKTVAAEYRFTSGDTTFTLGETTAVKTGSGAFSLTGVYTEGGGTFRKSRDPDEGKWAYLYDAAGKRGYVLKCTAGPFNGYIEVGLGTGSVNTLSGDTEFIFTPALSADGVSSDPAGVFGNY